jgi:hypothetical protein
MAVVGVVCALAVAGGSGGLWGTGRSGPIWGIHLGAAAEQTCAEQVKAATRCDNSDATSARTSKGNFSIPATPGGRQKRLGRDQHIIACFL